MKSWVTQSHCDYTFVVDTSNIR